MHDFSRAAIIDEKSQIVEADQSVEAEQRLLGARCVTGKPSAYFPSCAR
jgi:hypothetical protein